MTLHDAHVVKPAGLLAEQEHLLVGVILLLSTLLTASIMINLTLVFVGQTTVYRRKMRKVPIVVSAFDNRAASSVNCKRIDRD